MYIFNKLLIMC